MPPPTGASTLARTDASHPGQAAAHRGGLLNIDQAGRVCGKTPRQLLALLKERERHIAAGGATFADVPEPAAVEGGELYWGELFEVWALRLGIHTEGYNGRVVIGYSGIALMLGIEPQTVRKWASARTRHIEEDAQARDIPIDEAEPWPEDMPGNVDRYVWRSESNVYDVPLFDPDEVRVWAIQTRRLAPDGVTPLPRGRPDT